MKNILNLFLVWGILFILLSCSRDDYFLDPQNDLHIQSENIYKANRAGPDFMISPPPEGDSNYSNIMGNCNSGSFYIRKGSGDLGIYGPGGTGELHAIIQGKYSKETNGKYKISSLIVSYGNSFYADVKTLEKVISSDNNQIVITLNLEIKSKMAFAGDEERLIKTGKSGSSGLPNKLKEDTLSLNDIIAKEFKEKYGGGKDSHYSRIKVNINPCSQKIK